MIVLTLTDCPNALRGDLTRWLFEVDTNIYVGAQSARVRDNIWRRVVENAKSGRAVMVFPANNEQGFDFRVHAATWEPIDFDGLKLMLRPHHGVTRAKTDKLKPGFSKAAKRLAAKRFSGAKRSPPLPADCLVADIETTGLSPETSDIIEIAALRLANGEEAGIFQALVRIEGEIPPQIAKLTGITNEQLAKDGRDLCDVMRDFHSFAGELPIVSHNSGFDMGFLHAACKKLGLPARSNMWIDTLRLSRKLIDDAPDYKLGTLVKHLGIEHTDAHRGIGDCRATMMLYNKLRAMLYGGR
ncbi:MAG: type I-E CRISPR-associated endoribonuclease Cas2e [Oscillospiraceae bacterium]|jgi:CRISPR-associated protein Cas2|nr:type I-E CRISPR-associated endoribonuclease Cas2e [Oscillospiraceae bacterium]